MARPHVECVNVRDLAWSPANLPKGTGGARQKVLSQNWDNHAASLYVQLDPGWKRPKGYHHADTEIYVLEGALTVGDKELVQGCYFRAPRHKAVGPFETTSETTILYFREGPANYAVSDRDMGTPEEDATFVDSNSMEWKQTFVPGPPPGLEIKLLYSNPKTKFYTRLLFIKPGWEDTRLSHHPVMEESFTIAGESWFNFGHTEAGSYFFRPPFIRHGHFKAGVDGKFSFLRSDGELVNLYTKPDGTPENYDPDSNLGPVRGEPVRSISEGDWDGDGMLEFENRS